MTEQRKPQRSPDTGKSTADEPRLPKRFYTVARVVESENGATIELDGRPVRTPARKLLETPNRAVAEAVCGEWNDQRDVIDPATMPLTRLVNTALDGVAGREAEVADDITQYAGSDLLCYRAEHPESLVVRQQSAWDPVLGWARERHAIRLTITQGIMPVMQEEAALATVRRLLDGRSVFELAALHVMTSLTGSAVLALAVDEGVRSPEEAWAVAHVDEDFQISQWGEDAEARQRRALRWREMSAAAELLAAGKSSTVR